jgi:alkanesulfonate monooxygenase SsuD/methylene tetrahydromethanopterin reductase-like flavin-dependent oxidoreductase (luciferase family)
MGAGGESSIRRVAAQGFNLLLGQYASPKDVARNIAVYKSEVEAHGRRFDPMQIGVTRAFFVADSAAEREAAMERRLQNRTRQLKLATRPDGTVHGGPDRATGDPRAVNEISAMYGTPEEIAEKLDELREAGIGYVLLNGGGSGGGARGRESLRRFAREVMPAFAER